MYKTNLIYLIELKMKCVEQYQAVNGKICSSHTFHTWHSNMAKFKVRPNSRDKREKVFQMILCIWEA